MKKLSALPRIIGVKDAAGDPARATRTRQDCGADFLQFSGDDALAAAFLAQGAVGCISVASNVAPRLCAELQNAWARNDIPGMVAARDALAPLVQTLFLETNPGPLKYAMSLLGLCSEEMRLPMVPCTQATKDAVEEAVKRLGLLQNRAA